MKNIFVLFVLVSGALLTSGHAATKAGYQPATVVSVESIQLCGRQPFRRAVSAGSIFL